MRSISIGIVLALLMAGQVWGATYYQLIGDAIGTHTNQNSTDAADSTNHKAGTASFAITPSGASAGNITFFKTYNAAIKDLSGKQGVARVFIPAGSGTTAFSHITQIYISVLDSAGKYNQYTLWTYAQSPAGGWYEFPISFDDFSTTSGTGIAGCDLTDIREIDWSFDIDNVANAPSVSWDEFRVFTPRNAKGLIYTWADGTYANQDTLATYMKAVSVGSYAKPSLVMNTTSDFLNKANQMTTAQLTAQVAAGNYAGLYGWKYDTSTYWINMTDPEKLAVINAGIAWYAANGFHKPKTFSISGTSGWIPSDNTTYLYQYFNVISGNLDYGAKAHSVGLYTIGYAPYTTFVSDSALVSKAFTNDGTTLTFTAVDWYKIHPVKVSTTTTLPDPLVAGTIYWLKLASTTTATIHPTATDAMNGTNGITLSGGSGTQSISGTNQPLFGKRTIGFLRGKGVWSWGTHANSANELATSQFEIDAFVNMVNAGEALFVTPDELVAASEQATDTGTLDVANTRITDASSTTKYSAPIDCSVAGNTIGIVLDTTATSSIISNLTIVNCPIGVFNTVSGAVYNTITNDCIMDIIGTNTGSSNIGSSTDPLFVSASDFHLQSGSPALNSGVAVTGVHDQPGCLDAGGDSCATSGSITF
jgi:hypothetical protein